MPELETVTPPKEDHQKIVQGQKQRVAMTLQELEHHKISIERINQVSGFLHKVDIKGEQAMSMADCLFWLKNLKISIKSAIQKVESEVKSQEARLKQLEGASNGNKN